MSSALDSLIRPKSLAILGASRDPHKWGQRVIRYTRSVGFVGDIFAVNPRAKAGSIPGATVLGSIEEAPSGIDCAFLALPHEQTEAAVASCCATGVGTIVVAASGFGESSEAGASLEQRILDLAASSTTRLLGPNCFGVYSSPAGVNLTPFEYVPAGSVGLVSQSGNVSAQLFLAASRAGIGFSYCVGVGNQLDVGFGDLLVELADDPVTRAVALYIEGLSPGGGDQFVAGVERCRSADKPVVVIKAGASQLAATVAQTHTRSLAADDRVWDTVLARSGAIRVTSVPEMVDMLQCAVTLPSIGRRVAIITDGGGDSVMALDALASARHLVPARFDDRLVSELGDLIPPAAPRVPSMNPLTLDTAGGVEDDPEVLARCVDAVARTDIVDVVLVAGLFGTYTDKRDAELRAAHSMQTTMSHTSPAVVFQAPIPPSQSEPLAILAAAGVPFFESADRALRTLDRLVGAKQRSSPSRQPLTSPSAPHRKGSAAARQTDDQQWSAIEAADLLRAHGITMPTIEIVQDDEALLRAASRIGYPICLKTADVHVVHKSDVGGVRLGLTDESQLVEAGRALRAGGPAGSLLVMPSLPAAFEMLVGGFFDVQFGPVVVIGRGGVLAEVEADTRLVTSPVTPAAAEDAIAELRCYPVLQGYRSSPPLDLAGLRDIVVSLGSTLADNPTITVDLNPVLVYQDSCAVADVRVMSRDGALRPFPTGSCAAG